jgi:hypothetical protein
LYFSDFSGSHAGLTAAEIRTLPELRDQVFLMDASASWTSRDFPSHVYSNPKERISIDRVQTEAYDVSINWEGSKPKVEHSSNTRVDISAPKGTRILAGEKVYTVSSDGRLTLWPRPGEDLRLVFVKGGKAALPEVSDALRIHFA